MTREKAIIDLKALKFILDNDQYTDEIEEALDTAISALQQPEIIRCKDCEYYHPYYCEVWSKFGIIQTRENGYCYMAERREE